MRPITTLFMALLATFIMTACSQEKPPAQEPAQTAPVANIPAIDAAQQAAEEAKQRVEETAAVAKTEAEKSVEAVKEHAAAVTEQAAVVKEQAAEVKEQAAAVKEQAAAVTEQTKAAATETAAKVKQEAAAAAAVASASKGPKVVGYEGSMGKVTFDHAGHAENMACSKCHPTDPAVTIVMNKEVGHTLCKDCHQSSGGNAPTSCAGCHVK